MKKDTPPKKPLTPFFMFTSKEKIYGKEAGKKWGNLSDAEKKPYMESFRKAKEKYEKYLVEVEGINPKSSSKKKEKPTCFKPSRLRAAWGRNAGIMQGTNHIYQAMGRVVVTQVRS
jgi:hypothetical protein